MRLNAYIQLLVSTLFLLHLAAGEALAKDHISLSLIQQDTSTQDTARSYQPSKRSTYEPSYRFGDPFSNRSNSSALELNDPSTVDLEVSYDSGINYTIYERVGEVNFRPTTTMSFEEYDRYNDQEITKEYFQERSAGLDGESAVSGRNLIPRIYISPVLDRLFGGSYVDITPNGFVNLDFGGRFQRVNKPQVPLRQQRNGGFTFNQQISMNIVGKVGEKLAVTANFDNNNTFDFQNNLKVEYTGYEEDIVKKIEIGNVSMPVTNSLMTGAQSLFGVKTQLQFGKLFVTTVMSRQQGQVEVIPLDPGGARGTEFLIRASDYDENRHFFLGHFFRNNYESPWLSNLPQIVSGINITRIEVYVLNTANDTRTTRNVLALMDLGEGAVVGNPNIGGLMPSEPTDNEANNLYATLRSNPSIRNSQDTTLFGSLGLRNTVDYFRMQSARKLEESEYTLNRELGYISLLRKLSNNEALAVAFEYTYNGQVYKVGELTEDYNGLGDDQAIYMKMLRPNKINTDAPTWDLMMKNIYNLRANQIEREDFTLKIHYRDDRTGYDKPAIQEGRFTKDRNLLELLKLDQLNRNNDRQRDGNFDFIEGVTIDTRNGNIIFPVLEPFGESLRKQFAPDEPQLVAKYVYDTLYETTKANAEQIASKNKFFIQGKYNASSSGVIQLPGLSIAENSVIVTAGSIPLTEGLDYTVDYNLGQVRILNQGILSSGKNINVTYEKADLFNFQSRWLTGARFDYQFNDRINVGATVLHLNERPGGVSRYKIGDEPTSNTKYGFDVNFQEDWNFLTKMVDALPLVSTKAPSNISFNAEFAQMIPGTSNIVDGEGTSYIDDFETAITPILLTGWQGWHLAGTPETENNRFIVGGNPLGANFKRAKIAWYTVDNTVFYQTGGISYRPENIEEDDLKNHYVRQVFPQEIFRGRSRPLYQVNEPLLDIAYFPSERGQYNFNGTLNQNGLLSNPAENWAGITRANTNEVDFNKLNVEYLEFWLLDPFIEGPNGIVRDGLFNTNNTTGGKLIFNLGSVSEDLMKDGLHAFESGLPSDGDAGKATPSPWGVVPDEPFLTNYFENTNAARTNQDIGLDGLDDTEESTFYSDYLGQLNVSGDALQRIEVDPAGDNFRHYLGPELDNENLKILERYKYFNGLDGNSPQPSNTGLPNASTTIPDNEDLNRDNTISNLEEYFEYEIDLRQGGLQVGRENIIDQVTDASGEATWYLFRVPVRRPDRIQNNPRFDNIQFVRMYLTGFQQPVVLRMAKLQLVGSQWRKYTNSLKVPGFNELPEQATTDFNVSVVSIEDNSVGTENKSPYVVPPGIRRDRDNTTIINQEVNEQSLQICVEDLPDQDSRAVFKNVSLDLINYGRMKMFLHAESYQGDMLLDDELTGFVRLATDENENYYEIEIPLKVTPQNVSGSDEQIARLIWPSENEIDISFDELMQLKSRRNRNNLSNLIPYSATSEDGRYNLTVKGNPDLSAVLYMMVGVRNPRSDDGAAKSVCMWANELRVTDFDKTKGWAANARLSTRLADLATVTASTRYTSIGFGNLSQTIQQRTREETFQYDVSANVAVDKFLLPEKTGIKVPMFVSYEETRITPQFDPLDPDVPLDVSLASITSASERADYRDLVIENTERKSINFTNVHKEKVNPEAKTHFFDVENLSVSYAYSESVTSNITTETYLQKNESAGLAYNYSPKPLVFEPFKSGKLFSSPYLRLIKDINFSFLPNNLSFRGDLSRSFTKTQYYTDELEIDPYGLFYERLFTFARSYGLRWAPFTALSLDYSARANAVIDEPDGIIEGDINKQEEKEYILDQIKNLGRMKGFSQDVTGTYRAPLDKLPLTDWVSADLRYAVGYTWTAGAINRSTEVDTSFSFLGHTIQNRRDRGIAGKLDLVKLYNKVTFLKAANAPPRKPSGGEESKGPNVVNGFLRLIMSVRSVNFTYNVRESTTLSGFDVTPRYFGMDSAWNSPGWAFILGEQNARIRYRAAENNWLTENPLLTLPFLQTYGTDMTVRASVEPGRDFKIQLDAKRTNNASYQEIFRYDTAATSANSFNGFRSLTPSRSGNYSLSTIMIKTAFQKKGEISPFEQFSQNIQTIQTRLLPEYGSYDTLSQDVLIPAFLAAYTGEDAGTAGLSPFPEIPLPNWRIDYTGLSKIPAFAAMFSSVSLTHGYRSIYNVTSYTNSLEYSNNVSLDNNILDYPHGTILSDSGNVIPVYIINQVTLAEQFAPLIGINIRTKSNLSARIDYKLDRNLSLNMSNAQITETANEDITLDLSMTKSDFKLPFKIKGRTITLENDLIMRVSLTLRDSETIQRKLEGESRVTNGTKNFQMRPSFTYKLNDRLDLTGYFERVVTNPKISSFRTATTAFGVQLRFGLTQ